MCIYTNIHTYERKKKEKKRKLVLSDRDHHRKPQESKTIYSYTLYEFMMAREIMLWRKSDST